MMHPKKNSDYYFFTDAYNVILGVTAVEPISDKLVKLHGTVIDKDHRGKKLSSKMWSLLENQLKKDGIEKAMCEVYYDNFVQIISRLRLGFLVEGLLRDNEEIGKHEYILGKRL